MSLSLAPRLDAVKPSPTLAVTALAAELRAAGRNIISLSAGEPDFDTPAHIKAAAQRAIDDGFTKYTPVDGIPQLKQAIVEKFSRDNQLEFTSDQVLVSNGAKQTIYNLLQATIDINDEVLIPAPYWVSYPDMVLLASGIPVSIDTTAECDFKITPEQLSATINDKTKMLIINSPSNPSGMAYTRQELEALAKVLLEHPQIIIASDDMYEHILWRNQPFVNLLNVAPQLANRTVVINGVSKAYAMTGWRIGYAAGPQSLINAMKKVQSQSTSGACSISQIAATAALNGSKNCVQDMCAAFQQRHDYIVERFNNLKGFHCRPGDGTFYAFPAVTEAISAAGVADDVALARLILDEAGVAMVPGSAFGSAGHLRASFASSHDDLEDALDRLQRMFN